MFQNATQKSLQWLDNNMPKGIVNINKKYHFEEKTKRPIERTSRRIIQTIGRVNYAMLDQFIMNSLNDYYKKLNDTKNAEDRNAKIVEYNTLYQLWYTINAAKQRNDPYLNSYYDDIVYRLYLLGYHS